MSEAGAPDNSVPESSSPQGSSPHDSSLQARRWRRLLTPRLRRVDVAVALLLAVLGLYGYARRDLRG